VAAGDRLLHPAEALNVRAVLHERAALPPSQRKKLRSPSSRHSRRSAVSARRAVGGYVIHAGDVARTISAEVEALPFQAL
jgi:hypothetical protein